MESNKKQKIFSLEVQSFINENFLNIASFESFLKNGEKQVQNYSKLELIPNDDLFCEEYFVYWEQILDSTKLVEKGCIDLLVRTLASTQYFDLFYKYHPNWFTKKALKPIFEKPSFLHIQWLYEKGFSFEITNQDDYLPFDVIAKYGDISIIKWFDSKQIPWSDAAYTNSIESDNLYVFSWLMMKRKYSFIESLLEKAVQNLSARVIWWIISKNPEHYNKKQLKESLSLVIESERLKAKDLSSKERAKLEERIASLPTLTD